jgi:hypothetical protein
MNRPPIPDGVPEWINSIPRQDKKRDRDRFSIDRHKIDIVAPRFRA